MAPVNMNWTTQPQRQIDLAKARVEATLHESAPKLTTLEKAFRASALRQKARHQDRKSTRLNSSHTVISYAVFCLKKKKIIKKQTNIVGYREGV